MVFDLTVITERPMVTDRKKALFLARKMLPEYVFDASKLEGNPITFPEVQTLIDGITVGGRKISDVQQVLNIRDAWQYVFTLVQSGEFSIDFVLMKNIADSVNARIAREEALEWGKFRTGNVGIAGTSTYKAPPCDELNSIWNHELHGFVFQGKTPVEIAIRLFLWMALNQFYWDGNKRTARLMASAYLLSQGIGVFNIHAKDIQEFNAKMVTFYDTKNGDVIAEFLRDKAIVTIE